MTSNPQVAAKAPRIKKNRGIKTPSSATRPPPQNPRLSIITLLNAGLNPAKISAKLGIPESTMQYHLTILKKQGAIRKVGYGTWEILTQSDSPEKRTAGSTHVGIPQDPTTAGQPRDIPAIRQTDLARFKKDSIRAHAFMTTWQVPRGLRNWNNAKRVEYLTKHAIPFEALGIGGGGQRILVMGRKVWLTDRSIIVYDKASYFAEKAKEAKSTALATHLSIMKHVERLLHVEFRSGADYKFKVSRQHMAMIHNDLAKHYTKEGLRLEVRNGNGLWLLVDNSLELGELEGVRAESADKDIEPVQGFFNGLNETPITPKFVLEMMYGIQANQAAFAENLTSHISAVRDLGSGVRDLNKLLHKKKEQ